jgi:CHRD domain
MAGSSDIPLESNPNPKRRSTLKMLRRLVRTAVMASAFASLSIAATAATVALKADLKASSEVPPKDSAGKGTLTATLDTGTNELKYHVEFSGLTGPVVAAHFHGPAAEGANAKPQVPITTSPIASPIDGTTTITPEQAKDLLDGKWYFNLHTAANPGGEIRGQVLKAN